MADRPPLRPAPRGVRRRLDGRPVDARSDEASGVLDRLEREAHERDRQHRKRTLIGAGVVAVVAITVAVGVSITVVGGDRAPVTPGVSRPLDALGPGVAGIPGASGATFSPDGTRLAVRLGRGALGVADRGRFRPIVPSQTHVVAYAWYGTTGLLVQEGPVSTGRLAVIDIDGTDRGGIELVPDVQPGNGLAVNGNGSLAVITSYGDVDFGGEQTPVDLWLVELPSGRTRQITSTPAVVEGDVHFVDDRRLAATIRAGAGVSIALIDIATGEVLTLAEAGGDSRVVGVVGASTSRRIVWTDGDAVRATGLDGDSERLGSVPRGTQALSIDPSVQRLVVRETSDDGADTQLRIVDL